MDPTGNPNALQQSSANIANELAIDSLSGHLLTLRTRAEAQARLQLIDAYVVEVPSKSANDLLK